MSRAFVAIADSVFNPAIDRVSQADRLVHFDSEGAGRWSSAKVIRPDDGAVVIDRKGGVAIIAAKGAKTADIRAALNAVPDPIVILALDKTPTSTVTKDAAKRKAQIVVPGDGGLVRVDHINERNNCSCSVSRIAGSEPSPPKKAAIQKPNGDTTNNRG